MVTKCLSKWHPIYSPKSHPSLLEPPALYQGCPRVLASSNACHRPVQCSDSEATKRYCQVQPLQSPALGECPCLRPFRRCHKVPHRAAYTRQKCFSDCSGGWKSKVRRLAGQVRVFFWVADFSLCPHVVGGAKELPGVSFMRSPIPLVEAPPS